MFSQINTVGGLAFHFGKNIIHTGYKFKWKKLSIEIMDMDGKRIDKVLVNKDGIYFPSMDNIKARSKENEFKEK